MKNWRDRNPEKMEEANRKRRESIDAHFKIYARSARLKKLQFTFSEEEFKDMVVQSCYYCDTLDEKGFNGIDRMNQSVGYIQSNSVSCCAMCNWMKGSLDSATFIKRIRHIHSFIKNTENVRHPECFPDAKCVSYLSYRSRAEKKELEFAITNDDYKSIILQDCYLCGKKPTETNINGVDRVDNAFGYNIENCKACCKECNHMKNNFGLEELLGKIERIKEVWTNRELPILPAQIHSIVSIAEKMTKEDLQKAKEDRKQRTLQKHHDYLNSIGVELCSSINSLV
jgi:hypothetical protein